MSELLRVIDRYGLSAGILLFVIYMLVKIAQNVIPGIVEYLKKSAVDIREHKQDIEKRVTKQKELEVLTAQGSRTFMEDQLTMMTAETQTQLADAYDFIKNRVAKDIQLVIEQNTVIISRLDSQSEAIREDVRSDLQHINLRWGEIATKLDTLHRSRWTASSRSAGDGFDNDPDVDLPGVGLSS